MKKIIGMWMAALFLLPAVIFCGEKAGGTEGLTAEEAHQKAQNVYDDLHKAISRFGGDLDQLQKVLGENVVVAKPGGRSSSKRKVYHITPVRGVGWKVRVAGAKRASLIIRPYKAVWAGENPNTKAVMSCALAGITEPKKCAIARASELAKKAKLGQVVIHGRNGRIQKEYTYGKDPFPPKG